MQSITSPANSRIKDVVRLQRQARRRRKTGLFCVETERDLRRAVRAGCEVMELYATAGAWDAEPLLGEAAGEAECFTVSDPVLAKAAYRENPSGFVAVLRARRLALEETPLGDPPALLVCSGLEKPGNLGAILRTADAVGCDAVLVDRADADLFNPNCVRASTGAVFGVPIVCAEADGLIAWLNKRSVTICAATPEAERPIDGVDLRQPFALVVGSEAEGLADCWRDAAGVTASIPMHGRTVDSLNVSVTAALLLYEAKRQRRE